MQTSLLARYFACAAGAEHEEDWMDLALDRLARCVQRGNWTQAGICARRFMTELEAHFAFEELVIARTGFDCDRDHRLHHDEGLEVLERLGRRIADAAKADHPGHRDAILDALQEFRRHAHSHFAHHDAPLWRHAGQLAGIAIDGEASPVLP